jgi:hypothetical protein
LRCLPLSAAKRADEDSNDCGDHHVAAAQLPASNWYQGRRRAGSRLRDPVAGFTRLFPMGRLMTVSGDDLSKADTVTVAAIESGVPMLSKRATWSVPSKP